MEGPEPAEWPAWSSLATYRRERDALLKRIVRVLEADRRVRAAWLSGSFGRGEDDEWSDLDLHVAVEDGHMSDFLEERQALYRHVGCPILVQQDMTSDSQAGARFQLVLYAGAIEVDWNIGPLSQAERPVAFQMLVERTDVPVVTPVRLTDSERPAQADRWLTFFWAMAPIGVKHCGRRESRRAADQIDLLSTAFIALWRLVTDPEGPNPHLPMTNRILEPQLDWQLPQLGPDIDPLTALNVIRALCKEVEALHPALSELGVVISQAVPGDVAKLGALAEAVIRQGGPPQRKYR